MIADKKSLDRFAQCLFVQYKKGTGSPPQYEEKWNELYDAKVESVTLNINTTPNEAVFWMPTERWNAENVLGFGDKVRIIYYPEPEPDPDTGEISTATVKKILFIGYITKIPRQFSGGNSEGGKYERLAFVALDARWLLNVMSPCYGQIGRSQDDYVDFGTETPTPIINSYTDFTGRRCIFNPQSGRSNKPNCDKEEIDFEDGTSVPCFANPDDDKARPWTAYLIMKYILGRITNLAFDYFPIVDPAALPGLPTAVQLVADKDNDWNRVLNNISIEGLNTATALQFICKQIGWAFRIDYDTGQHQIVFFKAGSAGEPPRFVPPDDDTSKPVTLIRTLFAPAPLDSDAPNESKNIKTAVEAGKIPLWAAQFEPDITSVINTPHYFGSPFRAEFTAELVPAWLDSDLVPDASNNYANLFLEESDIPGLPDPNQYTFCLYYHAHGSGFKRDVGRIWALNESGRYALTPYDRGLPFDLSLVIPPNYCFDKTGRRLFGAFDRELLPCLTKDLRTDNSVGIVVEFSFDGGVTWEKINAGIISLDGQCGIYISETNLAEIKPQTDAAISGGALDGIDLNYWTSLCNDKIGEKIFKEGQWQTRVRVTASIQLDQRLGGRLPALNSGSPFKQTDIWDKSGDYHHQQRALSSIFSATTLPVDVRDDSAEFTKCMTELRNTLQDASVSGQFTLERLWLDEIRLGDCISKIEGREFVMRSVVGEQVLCPEIVQIIYLVQKQKMKLITRDLRFSEKK